MAREIAVVADEGVEACAAGDRARAMALIFELIAWLEPDDTAAQAVCALYENALVQLRAGRVDAARRLFQALRTV